MSKTIINNHIPRTIFGVKYNHYYFDEYKKKDIIEMNCLKTFEKKKEQLIFIQEMKCYPEDYSDIKELKWCIKP